jgi:hypothetical protein
VAALRANRPSFTAMASTSERARCTVRTVARDRARFVRSPADS